MFTIRCISQIFISGEFRTINILIEPAEENKDEADGRIEDIGTIENDEETVDKVESIGTIENVDEKIDDIKSPDTYENNEEQVDQIESIGTIENDVEEGHNIESIGALENDESDENVEIKIVTETIVSDSAQIPSNMEMVGKTTTETITTVNEDGSETIETVITEYTRKGSK